MTVYFAVSFGSQSMKKELEIHPKMSLYKDVEISQLQSRLKVESAENKKLQEEVRSLKETNEDVKKTVRKPS